MMRGLALLLCLPALAHAQSPTETCVEVVTRRSDAEELRRLVIDELDRHPTHRSIEPASGPQTPAGLGCASHLRVEFIAVEESWFVTGRINNQVPHREAVVDEDLAEAISRMLRVVLHNDPVRLRGPRSSDWLRGALRGLKEGRSLFGVEAYAVGLMLDGEPSNLSGVAITFRREVAQWHLGARLGYAGFMGETPGRLVMRHNVAAQLQLAWFHSALTDLGFYLAGLLGVEHQRFAGPAPLYGPDEEDEASATGVAVGVRAGLELFRTTSSRVDLFTQFVAPAFLSADEEGGVVDSYVPTLSLGAGMLF